MTVHGYVELSDTNSIHYGAYSGNEQGGMSTKENVHDS